MAEEQQQAWTCVLCGKHKGSYSYYQGTKDESLYLCTDCLKSVSLSVGRDQLASMTTAQLRRHMEVRDKLAATYRSSFVATKTFCVGKRRSVPILEVDEQRGLWALPKAPMPLAQSISSIVDLKVVLSADDLDADDEMTSEIVESLGIKDLLPFLRTFITKLYRSKHTDLAPIPEGRFVSFLNLVLLLDDQESGLSQVEVDLLPFWLSLPSRVDAGYDCVYEIIEYLKQLAHDDYERRKASGQKPNLACNNRLSSLAASGQVTDRDAELLRYYLERVPSRDDADAPGSSYALVKSVADAVSSHILFGEKVPDWKTQHTVGTDAFLGAFHRYAPGLLVSDVVYLMDPTSIQSGKGGMLLAQESFAVDGFATDLKEPSTLKQPIAYDDLLFVGMRKDGEDKGRLVLAYRDGRRVEVQAGKYAHYLFATINCILLLRSHE